MQDLTPRCYNAEGLIAEADASGQVTRSYGYAPGSTASTGSAQAFSTNPLWLKAAAMGSQTQSYYYYQNDHLGTPMKLLNQSGVVVWSATYDAFGRATINPASTVSNNLRFPGQYHDAETGLHYNWNRYYDSATGRYVTSDPIGLRGGINEYTYVEGNPLSFSDPTGELPSAVVGALIGAGMDIGIQLLVNGMKPQCIKWDVVAIAALTGAVNPFSGLSAANNALKAERQYARAAGLRTGSRAAKRTAQRGDRHNSRSMKEAASWVGVEGTAEGVGNLIPDERHIRIADPCECR